MIYFLLFSMHEFNKAELEVGMVTRVPLLNALIVRVGNETNIKLNQVVIVMNSNALVISMNTFPSQRRQNRGTNSMNSIL